MNIFIEFLNNFPFVGVCFVIVLQIQFSHKLYVGKAFKSFKVLNEPQGEGEGWGALLLIKTFSGLAYLSFRWTAKRKKQESRRKLSTNPINYLANLYVI